MVRPISFPTIAAPFDTKGWRVPELQLHLFVGTAVHFWRTDSIGREVQIYAADHPRDPAIYPAALETNACPYGCQRRSAILFPEDAIVDDDVLGPFYRDRQSRFAI